MILSKILFENREIGRYFEYFEFECFRLIGTIVLVLKMIGSIPDENNRLQKEVS